MRYVYEIQPVALTTARHYIVADSMAEAAAWWHASDFWPHDRRKPLFRITELYAVYVA